MLEEQFFEVLQNYSNDSIAIKKLWNNVVECYGKACRHYHTLEHLEQFYTELKEVKHQIKDWDVVLISMYYHDIVFLPTRNDNEKSSCEVAEISLSSIDVPNTVINKCQKLILATKKHERSEDIDTNFFTDADLSIIGSKEERYKEYIKEIQKEYYYLSETDYKIGRKKIIKRLLNMTSLYKTQHFFAKYEKQARKNLREELKYLS